MTQVIKSHNLQEKIGLDGLRKLGLAEDEDEEWRWSEAAGRILVLWHGLADTYLRQRLRGWPDAFALVVQTLPMVRGIPEDVRSEFGARVQGLPWRLPNLGDWQLHSPWKWARLRRFVDAWRVLDGGPPPWDVLAEPRCPEHVLACYLCAIAGVAVQSEWQLGFQEEVDYWVSEGKTVLVPRWNAPEANAAELRAFLLECGVIEEVL